MSDFIIMINFLNKIDNTTQISNISISYNITLYKFEGVKCSENKIK